MNLTNLTVNEHDERSILLQGMEFFLRFFPEYFPYALLSSFGVIIGIIGNLLIAGAIIVTKELHSTSNLIMFNLALADLSISVVVDSLTVVGMYFLVQSENYVYQYASLGLLCGPSYFESKPFLCTFVGFFCLMACEASLMTIGLIALNRFFFNTNFFKNFRLKSLFPI